MKRRLYLVFRVDDSAVEHTVEDVKLFREMIDMEDQEGHDLKISLGRGLEFAEAWLLDQIN